MDKKLSDTNAKKLAIVGAGPRGLSALESVYSRLATEVNAMPLYTFLFEGKDSPGSGQVYYLEQPDTNWLNVSERGLTIPGREEIIWNGLIIPPFPSYQEWAGYDQSTDTEAVPDKFPLRSTLGEYLHERYNSIASILKNEGLLELIHGEVFETDWKDGGFEIKLKDGTTYRANELVLTIGHQPTKNSDQIVKWLQYNTSNNRVDFIVKPYPIENLLKSKVLNSDSIVALRGFGLAMIDAMRALTIGLGGEFKIRDETTQEMDYLKSGREPNKIIPFSLDGLPMAPKLLNLEIDKWFFPKDEEKKQFKTALSKIAEKGNAKSNQFLIDAITPIISRVFEDLKHKAYPYASNRSNLQKIIRSWLLDKKFEHNLIVPRSDPAQQTLEAFVGMATGKKLISLDFCIGHVWRHCQPTLYKAISFSNLSDEVIASIIELDERLKRYAYGPPVASLQQLLALIKANLVSLEFVNNPEIKTTKKGWLLSKDTKFIVADIMVNSVLDAPKLMDINSPIVCSLLHESLVKPVHGELGIETSKNGCVSLPDEREEVPLAVLGRLSKGTLIGVDAILECFGSRSRQWAEGVIERHMVES